MSSTYLNGCVPPPLTFPDEIFLEIFQHFTDEDLVRLALVSKHIQKLALLSCLSRYGITESALQTGALPALSSGAFSLVRYITRIDTLSLRLDPVRNLHSNVRALQLLLRRLPVKSIELDFLPRPRAVQRGQCDIESFLFNLISVYRVRPALIVSPLCVSIVRPPRPPLDALRRVFRSTRLGNLIKFPLIPEQLFREHLIIFPIMRTGGLLPNVSLHAFDAPSPLGSVLVFRSRAISELRLPFNLSLSASESNVLFDTLTLSSLRGVEIQTPVLSSPSNYTSLRGFLCRHPSLEHLCIRGSQGLPKRAKFRAKPRLWAPRFMLTQNTPALPSGALPRMQRVVCSAPLLTWLLSGPNDAIPHLAAVEIELHPPATADAYRVALQHLARRSTVRTLGLHIYLWAPWLDVLGREPTPEKEARGVVDLRLTFKTVEGGALRNIVAIKAWLQLWPCVRDVSLADRGENASGMCAILRQECPRIKFTAYQIQRKEIS